MNNLKDIIQNKLKECRLKCGYTQKQVAEKLELQCEDRISHWERGQAMPSVKNLIRFSRILNVSVEQLIQ